MIKLSPQILLLFVCVLMGNITLYGQDEDLECRTSLPFCSDAAQELTFPNTTGDLDGLGEVGCLNTTPNPAWYFIRIDEPGELVFDIAQWVDSDEDSILDNGERQLDVDFIAWGPFNSYFISCDALAQGCDNNGDGDLSTAECVNNPDDPFYYIENQDNTSIIDCSYARIPDETFTETFTIPNAQSGEYYIILITNFADELGVIQLQQTNLDEPDAGTTDCSILEDGLGEDINTCGVIPTEIQGRFDGAVRYQWFVDTGNGSFDPIVGETNPFYTAPGPGIYRLVGYSGATDDTEVGSDDLQIFDVSNSLISLDYTIAEESFAGNYTLTAIPEIVVGEIEDFEFRLDREYREGEGFLEFRSYQSSPIFSGVPPGDYIIRGRHIEACSEVETNILMILGYPKYFTPNNDGFHDTWNLINIEDQPTALIYIFDRHGKLLKQLVPGGPGWDGTYNGQQMPSTDYWFRVEFNEPRDPNMRRRVFASNFTLKR